MINRLLKQLLTNTDKKEILSKAGVFVAFRVLGLLLGYLFTILVTNYFGSAVYGLVTLSFTLFMILSIFGKGGLDITFTRYIASRSYAKNDLIGLFNKAEIFTVAASIALATPIILFKSWISAEVFNKPQFEEYLFYTAITFPLWALILLHSGLYRGLKKNTLFSIFNSFGRFFLTVLFLLAGFYWVGKEYEEMPVVVHFLGILLLYLAATSISRLVFGYNFAARSSLSFTSFLKESRPILVSSIVFILLSWVDRLFIGVYLPETEVAIYDVAAKIALLISFNLDAINSILAPKVVELYTKKETKPLQTTITFSVGISSLVSAITYLGILVFQDFLLNLFGLDYLEGKAVLVILGLAQLLNCLSGSVGVILQMTGHQKIYQKIMLIGLGINLLLNFILIGPYGIEGVAIATFASMVTWNLAGIYYVNRHVGVQSFFNPLRYIKQIQSK